MDNAQGKKIYYGIVLDNAQLRQDAEQSKNIFRGIGDASTASASRIDSAYKSVSGTLMKLGAAVSAVELAKGIYNFADRFERSMAEVTTISETVTNDLGKFKQEIIEMSTEIPVPADEAAKALYQIVSAGHDGAAGLEVLRVSAKAAVGGVTETVTAADAITSILNAYKKGAGEAENISDQLFTTVRLGKTTMGELGHSISQAIPIAASFGIESEQVLAAIATLTKSGTPTAQAVTQVRAAIKAASEQLGDGYFKTHTFQQGLQEIATKAGGSEAKLRALVPEIEAMNGILGLTGINAQTAASDLEALSKSAGATEAAFQKMASETSSQLTILKNNVLAEFSELGESMVENVGKVAAALNEAFDTGKIDKLLSVLGSLIAMYGTYKATLIATAAIRESVETVKHTEQAAELYKLLTAEQQAQISKKGLAKTSAEYYAMVKAETAANVQAAQSALTKARADVTAANQAVASRRAEYIAAKQLEAQRLTELTAISATGSAKQVEAANRKLAAAEMKRESAAIAFQSATRDFNAKKTAVETAARRANTTATAVNTAAQTANATATGFLTVAKTRLAAVAARLNAVIMANPYALAAAAAVAFGYGLYKLITYQTEAEKAQKRFNEATEEFEKSSTSEIAVLNIMFSRLNKAKEGTDEYRAAKESIQKKYGDYLSKMGDEVRLLKDTTLAQKELTTAILETARARAQEKFIQQESDAASEKQVAALRQIREKLIKEKGEDVGEAIYGQIKSMLVAYQNDPQDRDGKKYTEYIKLLRENGLGSDIGYGRLFTSAYGEYINSVQRLLKAQQDADAYFGAPKSNEAEQPVFDATTTSLQQLMDRLPKAKEELAALKKAESPDPAAIAAKEQEIEQIKAKTLARERELSAIKDVKAQIEALQKEQLNYGKDDEEYKSREARIKYLKTKLPETDGQQSKAENEAARIKRETAERIRKIQEYDESVKKQVAQSELDITQAKIDADEEGFNKEMAQIDLTYKRLIFANQQREAQMVEALRDARALQWENENPTAKAKGETFDRSTVTAADLSPKEKAQIKAYIEVANDFKEKAEADLLKKLLDQYRTYEQQRTEITRQFDEDRAAIEKSDSSQSDREAALSVLEKKRKDAIKAVNDAEVESMQKSSDLLVKLFADASQKSVKELRSIINTTEELLTYLEQTDSTDIAPKFGFSAEELKTLKESPEKLKALQEALKGLNSELGSRSPFEKFANDIDKAIDKIKAGDIGGGLEGIGRSIQAIMPTVKQFGDDLGTIFGDSQIGENIGILTDSISGIGKGIQGLGEIASGDILGGITNLVSGMASLFSMANAAAEQHRAALEAVMNSKIAQQREYNLLLLEQNLLYEKGSTIFGTDEYGKAMNAIKVYKQALAELNDAMAGNDAQKKNAQRGNYILALFGIKDAQAALKQIYAGLADIEIVTGHKKTGLFGWGKGKDLYSSVLDVYDDLIDKEGVLNVERAKSILATRKMSDEDKNALQNIIELYEQYEEAMQSVRDYLSGIFGELGNTMSDALVDAFKNGSDAAEAFSKSVSDMLENLAQQMIYSVTLAPIMEKAQEQMLEIMKNGDLSDAEKFAQYAGVLSNLTDQALAQQENANYLMKLYQDMAAEKGIDLFQPDAERQASSKSIATASQDSIDELNGRFTAIQGHTFDIRAAVNAIAASKTQDLMKIEINTERLHTIDANVFGIREASNLLVANSARMLQHLAGIEDNTSRLHAMDDNISNMRSEMRTELSSVRHTVSDIALKGIALKR